MTLSATGGLALGSTYFTTDPGSGNMIVQGNVGIGTTAPQSDIDIVRNSAAVAVKVGRSDTNYMKYGGVGISAINDAGHAGTPLIIDSNGSGNQGLINFRNGTSNAGVVTINPDSGSIIIGNPNGTMAADVGYRLDVTTSGSGGTARFYDQTATTGSTLTVFRAGAGQSTNDLTQWQNNAGTVLSRVTSAGWLGIGTTTPATTLQVAGGKILLDNAQGIQFKDSAGTARTVLQVDGGDNLYLDSTAAGGDLFFRASGVDKLTIKATSGNVGIGTTTPTSKLAVNGALALKSPTTVNAATYTMASTDSSLIITTTNCTITLLSAATYTGRILYITNITAHSLTSNASNVVPLGSATAGTAILAATAGKFAMLQSDGTNWITMMSN